MREPLPLPEGGDTRYTSTREGLPLPGVLGFWGSGALGSAASLASALSRLCLLSPPPQFYLLCWCHAIQRSRPSSPRWRTTPIPSPRTLTFLLASSPRAIFQVLVPLCAALAPGPDSAPLGEDLWPQLPTG